MNPDTTSERARPPRGTRARPSAPAPHDPPSLPPAEIGVIYTCPMPFFGLLRGLAIAGAAMSLSSVSVIGNALRLRTAKL